MSVGKRYVLIFSFLLIYFVEKSELNEKSAKRRERHFFPLLGYLHGYRAAQNNYLQYQPYVFPPIIILPSVTQQQAVNIQKSYSDESYQENGGIFQYIQSAKLILNSKQENVSKANENACENDLNNDDDIAKQAAVDDRGDKDNIKISTNKTANINKTKHENTTDNETLSNTAATTSDISSIPISKDTIGLTTDFVLPNNQSHNFTTISNTTYDNVTITDTPTAVLNKTDSGDFNSESIVNSTETYPNAWYNNGLVDKIRLTTPYNVESTSNNDGWLSEANINSLSGFRPLAGLYYNGFLDKPVAKRSGFTPIKSKLDSHFFSLK